MVHKANEEPPHIAVARDEERWQGQGGPGGGGTGDECAGGMISTKPGTGSHPSASDNGMYVAPSKEHDDGLMRIPLTMEALTSYVRLRTMYSQY